MNYPHTATILENQKSGTIYTYAENGTTQCFLQPLDAEAAQLYGVTFGKAFNCYLPFTAEVQERTRLQIDGDTYGVKGIKSYNYGTLQHKRATLELLT